MSRNLTRRAAVAAIAAGAPTLAAAGQRPDAELIELGRQFEDITAALDREIGEGTELSVSTMDRFDVIGRAIVAVPATTIEGLRVKARAACWILGGDFEELDGSATDVRMGRSIIRDLIRLYDPDRERPNAIRDLLAKIERGATKG